MCRKTVSDMWCRSPPSPSGFQHFKGKWIWVTNETFSFNNWSVDSPDNNADKEHYAGFMSKEENYDGYPTPIGSWNDFQISSTNDSGYICEWDFIKDTNNNEDIEINKPLENQTNNGLNITFHIDNLSLFGGFSILGGLSFIGFLIKKHKKDE